MRPLKITAALVGTVIVAFILLVALVTLCAPDPEPPDPFSAPGIHAVCFDALDDRYVSVEGERVPARTMYSVLADDLKNAEAPDPDLVSFLKWLNDCATR